MATTELSKRSTMIVEFREAATSGVTADEETDDGDRTPTLTCTGCGSTGRVSEREMATANGTIDGVRRNVKCSECANVSERRTDVTT